jgi:ATP-dependent RNA helicase RhlE
MSFCDSEEKSDWRNIEKLIAMKIPVEDKHPYPMSAEGMVHINLPKGKDVVRRPNAINSSSPRRHFKPNSNSNNRKPM